MDRRDEHLAKNEILFRSVNEQVLVVDRAFGDVNGYTEFLCECGDPQCSARVSMSRDEYEHVRSDPQWFLVLPGHDSPEVEDLICQTSRFAIVEKKGKAGRLAEQHDPRD